MKVGELKKLLEKANDDVEVFFSTEEEFNFIEFPVTRVSRAWDINCKERLQLRTNKS